MLKYFFIFLNVFYCWSLGPRRVDDICSSHRAKRLYVELGESGVITALNLAYNASSKLSNYSVNTTVHESCSVEIITCPSCVVNVAVRFSDLNHCCGTNSFTDCTCRCDYVLVWEPPYEDVSKISYCEKSPGSGKPFSYKSKTRSLNVSLFYSKSYRQAIIIDYSAERNVQYFTGSPGISNSNATKTGVIISPYFPKLYPRDLISEYVISCANDLQSDGILSSSQNNSNVDPNCRIRLIFSDFQLSSVSILEFYETNHQRIGVTSGSSFRPPVILSSSPTLTIRFYANGESGAGFKGLYSFLSRGVTESIEKPITDCGGLVENFGGAITMMNMVDQGVKSYDCLWLIRPPENFLHIKTHLYLKVTTFSDFAGNSELQIREGLTSELPVLEILRFPIAQNSREHVVPINSGFYVSLRASFRPSSQLAITYAAFSYNKCYAGSEFLCQNHRCISGKLSCDGFDHCGDNSDEPALCLQDWEMQIADRRWYTHTPNYYFPKIERLSELKTASLIFIISSLGLITLISALLILLYRIGSRARQQRDLQSRLQTISELLDEARIEEIVDDPPGYDPPPDYDDVIKAVSLSSARRKEKMRSLDFRRQMESRRSNRNSVPVLEVILPSENVIDKQFRKIIPPTMDMDFPSPCNSSASQSLQIAAIPDSPPPPYSTASICFSSCRRASNDAPSFFSPASPKHKECLPDLKTSQQTWFIFNTPNEIKSSGNSPTTSSETRLLDLKLLRPPNIFKTHRRCHSCIDFQSAIKTFHDPDFQNMLNNLKLQKAKEKENISHPKEIISQLDIAIENEIKNLLNSCNHLNQSGSSEGDANFSGNSSKMKNPFDGLEAFPVAKNEITGEKVDDEYWEQFDKQFQDPNRVEIDIFPKNKKVAMLSKKYNSLKEDFKGEMSDFLKEKNVNYSAPNISSGNCNCNGACSCVVISNENFSLEIEKENLCKTFYRDFENVN